MFAEVLLMRRVALTPDNFPDRVLLKGFFGGAVYTADRAGKFYVIEDEGTMEAFLSEEDLAEVRDDLVKILEFDTFADRATYIRARGWNSTDKCTWVTRPEENMTTQSWLQPHLVSVLRNRVEVLRSWRNQANLQGRIKNLENWILVELNHQLLGSLPAGAVVLTNGFFEAGQDVAAVKRVQAADIATLRGRKSKVTNISADLSVRPNSPEDPQAYLIAELKTGLAAGELLDDLRLLRFYRDKGIATRAELGWVVILPENEAKRASGERTVQKICARLQDDPGGCSLTPRISIEDWLFAYVAIPHGTPLPNPQMGPTRTGL